MFTKLIQDFDTSINKQLNINHPCGENKKNFAKLCKIIARSFGYGRSASAICISRENWLSPVIQATWEARSVGWLEKEGSQRPGRMISVAALWPTCFGEANRGGQAPVKIQLRAARTEGREFEPSQRPSNIARPSSLYCNCIVHICIRKPNKKIFKKKIYAASVA